jgi:hypothetical protein
VFTKVKACTIRGAREGQRCLRLDRIKQCGTIFTEVSIKGSAKKGRSRNPRIRILTTEKKRRKKRRTAESCRKGNAKKEMD